LKHREKKNKKLDQWIIETESDPKLNGQRFESLLILPVQRIPRYCLLLREMLKHTWDGHVDYPDLEHSLLKMEEVASYLNNKKADADNIAIVNEIWNNISGNYDLSPDRRFVKEDIFKINAEKSDKMRKLYLFNDIIILTKPNKIFKKSKEKVDLIIQLQHLSVTHVSPEEFGISVHESGDLFSLKCDTDVIKKEWIDIIEKTAKNYRDKLFNRGIEDQTLYTSKKSRWNETIQKKMKLGLLSPLSQKEELNDKSIQKSSSKRYMSSTSKRLRRSSSNPELIETFLISEGIQM